MDMKTRIKYDDVRGVWRVLVNGIEQQKDFKTSTDAYIYLESLTPPKDSK